MPTQLVVITHYFNNSDAEMAKAILDSENIPCFLRGRNIAQLYGSTIVGGIKLLVPREYIEEAINILKLDEEKLDPSIRLACPICNSRDITQKSNLLSIVYRILKIKETITRQNECNRCGYTWEEELI